MKNVLLASFVLIIALVGCDPQKETLDVPPIADYYPLQVGSSQFYRLDSTVLAPFGTALVVRSYQAKDSVESTFTDNMGRQSYRIFRFIRNLAGTEPWRFAATYYATPTQNSLEYIDNNLRFVKLQSPIRDGFTFKGNSFILEDQGSPLGYLYDWDYEYQNVGSSFQIGTRTFENTVTVYQKDETSPEGPFNPASYQQRNLGMEVYAQGIGLIYKEFLHWTWQTTPPPAKYEDGSFGVKLTRLNP